MVISTKYPPIKCLKYKRDLDVCFMYLTASFIQNSAHIEHVYNNHISITADGTVLNEADRNFTVMANDAQPASTKRRKTTVASTSNKAAVATNGKPKSQPQVLFRSPTTLDKGPSNNGSDTNPPELSMQRRAVQQDDGASTSTARDDVNDQTQQRISTLERGLERAYGEIAQLREELTAVKNENRRQRDRVVHLRPPNLNDIQLLPIDIIPLQEGDTEVAKHHLSDDELITMRQSVQTKRRFIAQATRRMYSIYERAANVNVSGKFQREMLSPTKARFRRIASYAAHQYNVLNNEEHLRFVRTVIDETNRRYREELRLRKHRIQERNRATHGHDM